MVGALTGIRAASRGMAAIAASTEAMEERAGLAYLGVYACGYAGRGSLQRFKVLTSASIDTIFMESLASQVRDLVQIPGWVINGWDDRKVYLELGSIRAFVGREAVQKRDLVKGQEVSLELPAVLPGWLPGFVFRRGKRSSPPESRSRLYFNIGADDAAWVLGPLASRLEEARIAYEMKVLAHPRAYLRRDSAVVYVRSQDEKDVLAVVLQSLAASKVTLGRTVPALTRQIAPGLGFADEPSDIGPGMSHGQWVAGLFVNAARDSADAEEIAAAVELAIVKSGRNPREPYRRGESGVARR